MAPVFHFTQTYIILWIITRRGEYCQRLHVFEIIYYYHSKYHSYCKDFTTTLDH